MNPTIKLIKTLRFLCLAVVAASTLLLPLSAFSQGSLTPPGPPAPTMKKLDEIEPRTNLQAVPAPPGVDTSNADYHFIINQPGSYYLSGNLVVTKTNGIQINAEGVTLDLNGFQISQVSPAGTGIEISPSSYHATVRNGSIKGFILGISGEYARASVFRDLAVTGCTTYGISAGPASVLNSCRAHDNTGYAAIFADLGSSLVDCTASFNGSNPDSIGIRAARGGTLTRCTAVDNSGVGILAGQGSVLKDCVANSNGGIGIQGQDGCSIANCSAQFNSSTGITTQDHSNITNCNVSNNDVGGIFTFNESVILGCTISHNNGDGIRCNSTNTIEHNAINSNGVIGTGDGIHPVGSANRIDSNEVRYSAAAGIRLPNNGHNVVVRNTLQGNTGGNYQVGTGNAIGPIISANAGNVGNATNSPFANIQD